MMPFDDPTLPPLRAGRARRSRPDPALAADRAAGARPHPAPGATTAAAAAVAALLDAHGAEVYRHLRRLVPTAEDAADLHQETFLRALRALAALPADANHRAWLHRIAANAAADDHRRRAVRAAVLAPVTGSGRTSVEPGSRNRDATAATTAIEAIPTRDPAADPAARAESAELRSAVRAALAGMPWRERTAVIARVLEDRDYADVADVLDCSEANARQLVSRGIRRARIALAPYLETDR